MPRKAKPPIKPLVVEDIATGERIDPQWFVDDFTGEAMALTFKSVGHRVSPVPSAGELRRAAEQARVARARALLEATGLLPRSVPRMVAPHRPGMRPVAKLGGALAIYVPREPWRRV